MKSILVSIILGQKRVESEGKVIGDVSVSDTTSVGSKLNIPSRVPSDIWSPESLKGDVLGVVLFGFFVWGAETDGDGVSEVCNCKGKMMLMVSVDFFVVMEFQKLEEFL